MKIEGEHEFTASRAQVWDALQDPDMLAGALPGVKRLEPTGPDAYAITVSVGVGAVKGVYDGTFALADKQEREACTVRASASGGPGSLEAVARMRLRDGTDGGASLSYEAEANVSGPLAGVGQRLVAGAARRTTREFLEALDRQITQPQAAVEPARAQPPAAAAATRGWDPKVVALSALGGFLLALIGVAVGRRTAR